MRNLKLAATSMLAALVATGAMAQEATTFDIDRNPDTGMAAYEDFNVGFDRMGYFDQLDADRDGMLSRDEYNRAVFSRFDLDGDGMLNDEEIVGMQNDAMFYGPEDEQAQDEADTNN